MRLHDPNNIIFTAGSESEIGKTIEQLLDLNNLIPARTDEEVTEITEKQLAGDIRKALSDDDGKSNERSDKEIDGVSELQLADRHGEDNEEIMELRLDETEGQRRPESWDTTGKKERGHDSIPPLWLDIYKHLDERKKLDKGQMNKKLKKK